MTRPRFKDDPVRWFKALPAPILYACKGAGYVLGFMFMKGLILVIPLLFVLAEREKPLTESDAIAVGTVFGLAVLGGAGAGAMYGLVGRRLRRLGPWGDIAAGVAIVPPYAFVLSYIVRFIDDKAPLQRMPDALDGWMVLVFAVLVGPFVGHQLLRGVENDDFPRGSR